MTFKGDKMKRCNKLRGVVLSFVLVGLTLQPVAAQEDDNTGTNPANFTYDFSMSVEVQSWEGDNSYAKTAFGYSLPLSKTTSFRFRGYKIDLSLGNGLTASTTTGFGDMDARLL